jgi:hypothetical protein
MRQAEVAVILVLANGHDQRQGIDDVRVQAWWDLFNQEAPMMDVDFARQFVNRHYATSTDMLMPAHLITAWKSYRRTVIDQYALPTEAGVPMPEWFKQRMNRS